jgi:hypothetical protein
MESDQAHLASLDADKIEARRSRGIDDVDPDWPSQIILPVGLTTLIVTLNVPRSSLSCKDNLLDGQFSPQVL